jgi:hypothetical protein
MFSTASHKLHSTGMTETVSIARRFRGPLTSANGGYTCGLLAGFVDSPAAEVSLRLPPPLERPLTVTEEDDRWALLDGDAVVAEARAADPGLTPPAPPSAADAEEAATGAKGYGPAVFAECFVCGTRPERDGLEIHAGLVAGRDDGVVATTWTASEVRPEIVWAAIDCPGAYAVKAGVRGEPVLARMTGRIDRLPREGERCVVVGWPLSSEGRKHEAGTALYGEDGSVLAYSRQLWIEPRQD